MTPMQLMYLHAMGAFQGSPIGAGGSSGGPGIREGDSGPGHDATGEGLAGGIISIFKRLFGGGGSQRHIPTLAERRDPSLLTPYLASPATGDLKGYFNSLQANRLITRARKGQLVFGEGGVRSPGLWGGGWITGQGPVASTTDAMGNTHTGATDLSFLDPHLQNAMQQLQLIQTRSVARRGKK